MLKRFLSILSFILLLNNLTFSSDYIFTIRQSQQAQDSVTVDSLNSLSFEFRKTEPVKTIILGKEAYTLAKKLNYHEAMLKSLNFIGVGYRNISDYSSALKYYLEAYTLSDSLGILDQKAYALINQGNIFLLLDKDTLALDFLDRAQEIGNQLNDQQIIAYCNMNKGRVYLLRDKDQLAIDYIKKALLERKKWDDEWSVANTLNKLAEAYIQSGNYSEAKKHLMEIIDIAADIKGGENLSALAYESLGSLYRKLKNYTLSNEYFSRGINLGQLVKNRYLLMTSYKMLSENYKNLGNYYNAYFYLEKHLDYKDSVLSLETNKSVAQLEVQYQMEAKQKDNELLRKENELKAIEIDKQDSVVKMLVVIIVFVIVVASTILFLYKSNKNLNKDLIAKNEEVEKNRAELIELNKTKDKFFSIIAHDLKNPFMNILNSSDFLLNEYNKLSDADKIGLINSLKNSARTSYNLLENLLTWARAQRDQIEYEPTEFYLIELIKDNLDLNQTKIISKGIEIQLSVSKEIKVFADKKMIDTVFRNLIGNALKFTEAGGKIEITVTQNNDYILTAIKDNGIGISEKDLSKLFRIDDQLSTYGTEGEKGSGLGLIICKEFIEKHNGKIWAESIKQQGSKFSFTLPKPAQL